MKLTKQKTEFGIDVSLEEGNTTFQIVFRGNLDLYWIIKSSEESDKHSFTITKENYGVYILFDELYRNVEDINIFDKRRTKREKGEDRLYYRYTYNELFDKDNKTITWYSDETAHEVSNILKIKKEDESFKLDFSIQPHISGYDRDFNSPHFIPIRFRNSGSSYYPFNVVFMKMYNKLVKLDDINDYGHQMNMEEYSYQKNIVKKYVND